MFSIFSLRCATYAQGPILGLTTALNEILVKKLNHLLKSVGRNLYHSAQYGCTCTVCACILEVAKTSLKNVWCISMIKWLSKRIVST